MSSPTPPPIPVSHPRSSPRSPLKSSSPPQPPISPPRTRSTSNSAAASNGCDANSGSANVTSSTSTPTACTPVSVLPQPLEPSSHVDAAASTLATVTDGADATQHVQVPVVVEIPAAGSVPDPAPASIHPGVAIEPQPLQTAAMVQEDEATGSFKTPNVYINGLPPNFPEENLFEMTKDFGPVVSVRTFTRHVSERPSGYGFVLFETIDGAEKCIESLRRYRNLHPSFSKQIHKIPGTSYAALASSTSGALSPSPSVSSASDAGTAGSETFKARMERLKDESSTNLYMEGLPLSIDEATLGALVNPHAIKSSRFFQTKLSHPPRIIAFVRLESRAACEDIIERLHGRMVRGHDDPGSRISVRFADSAEQRELRRSERMGREGEPSPSRLSMAQAALLNLQGQQLRGSHGAALTHSQSMQLPRNQQYPADANLARHAYSRLPMHPLTSQYSSPRSPLPSSMSMPAYHNDGYDSVGLARVGQEIDLSHVLPAAVHSNRMVDAHGFTPLEQQLILQAQRDARAREEAERELALRNNAAHAHTGMRAGNGRSTLTGAMGKLSLAKEFVPKGLLSRMQARSKATDGYQDGYTQPSRPRGQSQSRAGGYGAPSLSHVDFMPSMSEDDFHATAQRRGGLQSDLAQSAPYDNNTLSPGAAYREHDAGHSHGATQTIYEEPEPKEQNARLSSTLDFVFADTDSPDQQQGQSHIRSTTLPPHFTLGGGVAGGRLGGLLSPDLGSAGGARNHSDAHRLASQTLASRLNIATASPHLAAGNGAGTASDSPLLVPSPALTYNSSSSSRTPSTLSPSTPFFGSFSHAGEGFGADVYKDTKEGDHTHSHGVHGHAHAQHQAFGARSKMRAGSQ
ncbi:hypothetical protein DENSPDRAFT_224517 [Dentipellis sp. KUC8613]|nr:hypothetical protein DENSPDRAFT_224517 [Dentipellis sp. KUC8613]